MINYTKNEPYKYQITQKSDMLYNTEKKQGLCEEEAYSRLTKINRTQVVLLHSNDIHSRLEQAAKIAGFIEHERSIYGDDRVLAVRYRRSYGSDAY